MERDKIIKALECCSDTSDIMKCQSCPYMQPRSGCNINLMHDALSLIKELAEENEQFRYEQGKLIEECDTFREYAYNMQKYVENLKHKEEAGYEPSVARYAAEMDMWRVVALEKKKLADENERLRDFLTEVQQYNEAWVEDNGKLRKELKTIKTDIVWKMQTMFEERLDISTCGYSTEEVVSDVLETLNRVAEEILEEKI